MDNPIRAEINQVLAVLAMIEIAARSVPEDDTAMSRVLFDACAALQGIADRLEDTGDVEMSPAVMARIQGNHDDPVSHFATIAEGLGVPLWVLFIPKLPKRFLQSPHKEQFVSMVNSYLTEKANG